MISFRRHSTLPAIFCWWNLRTAERRNVRSFLCFLSPLPKGQANCRILALTFLYAGQSPVSWRSAFQQSESNCWHTLPGALILCSKLIWRAIWQSRDSPCRGVGPALETVFVVAVEDGAAAVSSQNVFGYSGAGNRWMTPTGTESG